MNAGDIVPIDQLAPAERRLVEAATAARQRAYAPYSRFLVGAALETVDGTIIVGCNVENASYGATVCAERVAVFGAVAAGYRTFRRIAVIGDTPTPIAPCGMCRQVLGEFGPDIDAVMANLAGAARVLTVGQLLPHGFALPD